MEPLAAQDRRTEAERRAVAEEARAIRRLLGMPAIGDRTLGEDFASLARDPLTFLYVAQAALRQQPDIGHARSARHYWVAMIAANSRFWTAVAAESDNDREWIPNARQTSALPVTLAPDAGPAWLRVLDDAEAVLNGRLLIPHPMLPAGTGISACIFVVDPARERPMA
jgi:hypothetical protein